MKRAQVFTALAAAFLALLGVASAVAEESADAQQLDRAFSRSTLQIATADAKLHKFDVWIADNDVRRMRGLMFVQHLADDEGMLFVYPQSQPVGIWMKNTPLPLDILFVNADGRVHRVVENAKPQSLDTIPSDGPVLAVIELKGGSAARLNIRRGAQVIHPAFKLN
jgi:uncharacterized membrane protein (UPF0127 family)